MSSRLPVDEQREIVEQIALDVAENGGDFDDFKARTGEYMIVHDSVAIFRRAMGLDPVTGVPLVDHQTAEANPGEW